MEAFRVRFCNLMLRICTVGAAIVVFCALISAPAMGAEDTEPFISDELWEGTPSSIGASGSDQRGTPTNIGGSLVKVAGGLLLVVGVAVVAFILLKRSGLHRRLPGAAGKHVELLESLSLGSKRQLSLVRIGNKAVAIGHGENSMAALLSLEMDELNSVTDEAASVATASESIAAESTTAALADQVKADDSFTPSAYPDNKPQDVDAFKQRLQDVLKGANKS